VYIVLHRSDHAAGTARLRTLYAWGEGAGAILLAAVLAWGLTVFVVRLLTHRLSTLDEAMRQFEMRSGIEERPDGALERGGDEIDRLTAMFQRLSSRIEAQMQALQSTDTMRREVLANVSHDLRTPLTTLRAHLEALASERAGLSASDRREYVEVSLRQTKRLIRLVEQLLEVAKLDSAQVTPEIEPFSLADLVQDVVQKFALAAQERGVAIEIDLANGLPWVKADIGLIERVLDNLIENALRYSPRGGRVHVGLCREREETVRVAITDSGPGLKPQELVRIFERFYRADPGRSGAGGHAGLGLSIVKSILNLHGTTIEVEGRLGLGARFFFDLPAHRAVPVSADAERPERAFST
jgi:signal transduction histidine kinase